MHKINIFSSKVHDANQNQFNSIELVCLKDKELIILKKETKHKVTNIINKSVSPEFQFVMPFPNSFIFN